MTDQRTQHTIGQGAPVDLDEAQQLCDEATPGPLEAVALGSEGYAIRPVTGDMRKRARVAMCGYRTWAEDRANAEFFAAARTLLSRLIAELGECRAQRDENLANVRRIDDLRIAETARLQKELDAVWEIVKTSPTIKQLRALADWIDQHDDGRQYTGPHDVQSDLRALADALDVHGQAATSDQREEA